MRKLIAAITATIALAGAAIATQATATSNDPAEADDTFRYGTFDAPYLFGNSGIYVG